MQTGNLRSLLVVALAAAVSIGAGASAHAAPTSAQKCEAAIELAVGKYAQCRLKAESTFTKTDNAGTLATALATCATNLASAYARAFDRWGPSCPTTEPASGFDAFVAECTLDVEAAAAGAGFPTCGDGALNVAGEQCDGSDLGGETCASLGFVDGTLDCTPGCAFDTTACEATLCGNDTVDGSEQCDGADLGGASCSSLGFADGTLDCTGGCAFDTSGCDATLCGNGAVDGFEQCDGAELGGASCASLGYTAGGALACGAGCGFDTTGCASQAFPATGQTTCWDADGVVISCAGTGQDGDDLAGAALAYVDNGDGTITDLNTGLMWEKNSDDGSIHDKDDAYAWADAFPMKVAMLNSSSFAGHSDWRVPNLKELHSIVNLENNIPATSAAFQAGCVFGCTVLTCSCTTPLSYWSSTTVKAIATAAWVVNFNSGVALDSPKVVPRQVRAVRSAS